MACRCQFRQLPSIQQANEIRQCYDRLCNTSIYSAAGELNRHGQLNYDAEGIGGVHSALLIVTIGAPRPLLTSADILISL